MVQRIHPSLSVPSGTSLVQVLGFQQIASHFRDGIDKCEGDLSRRFDLAQFSDSIGLCPLERVILAASIVAAPTRKELATQASNIIQVEFYNAVYVLSFEPAFGSRDLSRDQIEKLLSDLLSKPPTGPPVLDATQQETLIVAAQSKYGKDTINPMVQRIHPSLSVPSGTSLVQVLGFQQIASHFRDGIDKCEGDLSRRFDLARFSDFIGLRPLERVILAASIVATPTGKELATQASSIIQVEFHNAVCALSFEALL
ncbi:hypothetical protein B0H14DRAFT_1213505 [Mycena olivaceomarginata]|nr:hypothetical protein B0H14DRAFT_1213505 [Mycena olivaceomarginata]